MTEIKIIYKNIKDLREAEYNPRKISDAQMAHLKKSLENFDCVEPVIVNINPERMNVIIGGHQRLKVMRELGFEDVPCIEVNLVLAKEKELNIRLNKNTGEFDFTDIEDNFAIDDLIEWGFDPDELNFPTEEIVGNTDADEVPEVPKEPLSKLGDIWILDSHRVMCGDSTSIDAVEKLMNSQKADMVFTDPPYGVSYADKNKYLNAISPGNRIQTHIENDHMNLEDTSDFILAAFTSLKFILAKRSSYYITAPQGGDLMMMMMMMMMMTKAGLPLRHTLIWAKNNHVLGRTDYNYKHEPILYGWDEVHDFYGKGEHRFSVWEIDKPLKNDLHPTMKPVALIENAVLNSTESGQNVADIFGGSGSTLIACEKTKRKCYMMELSPQYCDVIVKRWQDFSGKEAIHAETGQKFKISE